MALTAAQVIYTNVEKKLSATGRDGYQIWLKTPDFLDEREETEIQSRLSDYEERKDGAVAKDELPARHVFFSLSSGRSVIARTVPLNQTDEFKRGGRFYSHALVMDREAFWKLDNDPFAVLDQFTFHNSLDDGQNNGDMSKGVIPVALLDGKTRSPESPVLSREKLAGVLPVLLRTCQGEKPLILGVTASPLRLLSFLRQLFAWLPISLRGKCSFDTLSTGKTLTQLPFSIAGLPATLLRRYPNLLVYDLGKQAFPVAPALNSASSFEQWLTNELKLNESPPGLERNEAAYQLGSALDGGVLQPERLQGVEPILFEQIVCSDNGIPKLERLLWPRLQTDVGEALAPLIYSHAFSWLRGGGLATFKKLAEPIDPVLLLRWLLAAYQTRPKHAIQPEIEVPSLKDFLAKTKNVEAEGVNAHKRLVLIYYRWAGWWSKLAKSLCAIPDDLYYWFADWALRSMPLLVEAGSGPSERGAWCGLSVSPLDRAEDAECQNLLRALLGQGPLGEGETDAESPQYALAPERHVWVMHYLMQQLPAAMPVEAATAE